MCNENRCVEDECKEYQAKIIKFCRKINQAIVPFESFTSRDPDLGSITLKK